MTRFLRGLLYSLAVLAGLIGLVSGGKSLAKYAWARMKDPYFDSFSYNDLVFSGSVIFLLSLILLIFVEVGLTVGRVLRQPKPEPTGATPKSAVESPKMPAPGSPLTSPSEPAAETDRESADEKLARLLKQKPE